MTGEIILLVIATVFFAAGGVLFAWSTKALDEVQEAGKAALDAYDKADKARQEARGMYYNTTAYLDGHPRRNWCRDRYEPTTDWIDPVGWDRP